VRTIEERGLFGNALIMILNSQFSLNFQRHNVSAKGGQTASVFIETLIHWKLIEN